MQECGKSYRINMFFSTNKQLAWKTKGEERGTVLNQGTVLRNCFRLNVIHPNAVCGPGLNLHLNKPIVK